MLDVQTGELLRKVGEEQLPPKPDDEDDPAFRLYSERRLRLADGDKLEVTGDRDDFALRRTGSTEWYFALAKHSRYLEGNFYSWRLHGSRIFLATADAPVYLEVDEQTTRENKCRYELWELDAETGAIVAKSPLTTERGSTCRIEAVDDRYLVVSHERTIWGYRM